MTRINGDWFTKGNESNEEVFNRRPLRNAESEEGLPERPIVSKASPSTFDIVAVAVPKSPGFSRNV